MSERFSRQLPLLGDNSPALLAEKTVMLCGLGGVGGYVLEGLVRSGLKNFILVDSDCFDESNLNRQLLCTTETVGLSKTSVAARRVLSIDKNALCTELCVKLDRNNVKGHLEAYRPDYVIDAIDFVEAKLELAKQCENMGIPIISCMGTGNKLDPTAFECTDIYKTSVCPLAKAMRRLLKEYGVKKLKVLYSKELPRTSGKTVSSVSFVPSVAGLIIAGEVIKDLCNIN